MNNSFLWGIIVIGSTIGILHLYNAMHKDDLTVEKAMAPVHYLTNARYEISKLDYKNSIYELDKAIKSMKFLEQHADSVAQNHIDQAIKDLEMVEEEIKADSVIMSDLNKAYFNALNSIAYANLIIAEKKFDEGENYKAVHFMNETFSEMVTSLRFATDEEYKAKEKKAIADIQDILNKLKKNNYEYEFDYDSINKEVQEILEIQD